MARPPDASSIGRSIVAPVVAKPCRNGKCEHHTARRNRNEAMSGPDISEAEHEVVLHEEEPVVDKQTVPKERVRLEKDAVTDEAKVSENLRKERIETQQGDQKRR